ncbi:MAG: hypothetical protein R2867_43755 [Caldilineaceae bacterium]
MDSAIAGEVLPKLATVVPMVVPAVGGTAAGGDDAGGLFDYFVYVPIVADGKLQSDTINKPLPPDVYQDDGRNPPVVATDPKISECSGFIDITNFTDETIYIFWLGPNDEEILYKILASGRHYWQHTYRFNKWRVRDDAARLIKSYTTADCTNSTLAIYVDDLPVCGGILAISLWDRALEEPVAGYESLVDEVTVDLTKPPPVVIQIRAQDTVESIEVIGDGAVVALNELPYQYPPDGDMWRPKRVLIP